MFSLELKYSLYFIFLLIHYTTNCICYNKKYDIDCRKSWAYIFQFYKEVMISYMPVNLTIIN